MIKMTDVRKEVILAFADCNMNAAETARKTYRSYNSIEYHIGIIRTITGLDPKNFYDLGKLVMMVRGDDND